eukprot:282522-Chlamydomonas_euryale.AAC.1
MPKFVGPFAVTEQVGKDAYRLALPNTFSRVHKVFHVSLLQRYRGTGSYQPPLFAGLCGRH